MAPLGRVLSLCGTPVMVALMVAPSAAFTGQLVPSSRTRGRSSLDRVWVSGTCSTCRPGTVPRMSAMADFDDSEGNPLSAIRPLTEGPVFLVLQGAFALSLLCLVDAGFSGDWQAQGVLSDATAASARGAVMFAGAAHVLLTAASVFVADVKGTSKGAPALSIATGPFNFLKVAAMPDVEEMEAIEAAKAPPLSMEINSLTLSEKQSPSVVLLSTTIKAKKGREGTMRNLLETLVNETLETQNDAVLTCTVNQDPEERTNFIMLQRFTSAGAMSVYQNNDVFRAFTDAAEDSVDGPMGLYLVNERAGKLGEPVHPFGPGGEGGRDDSIYSSPANLQGSLTGF